MRKQVAIPSLFPKRREDILALTVLHPDRWWYLSDMAKHLMVQPSSLQRELARLAGAGVLRTRREGNRMYYQPDPACPYLRDLQGLLAKTAGMAGIVQLALQPFASSLDAAFIYGSMARGDISSASDVDVMIIGSVTLAALSPALRAVERRIQRPINAALYTRQEFSRKHASGHHFVASVMRAPKLFLKGDEHELDALLG